MQGLTKKQLLTLIHLSKESMDTVIFPEHIENLFDVYGDEYFKEPGDSPFELCVENPFWDEFRGEEGVPKKGFKA